MLDKLVSLDWGAEKAEVGAAGVEVDVWTDVPQPQIRLRLWNPEGRDPQVPPRLSETRWKLENPDGLAGCTLTWSVRLASDVHSRFELRLQVFRAGKPLPDGNFYYAGPLDGLEERSGRFHFTSGPDKTSS